MVLNASLLKDYQYGMFDIGTPISLIHFEYNIMMMVYIQHFIVTYQESNYNW